MKKTMKAYQLISAEKIEPREVERPVPGAGEVLVAVKRVGICGSDIEYYRHFACGAFVARRPFVLGHELSGVVAECGPGVDAVSVGERITVDPSMPCGHCDYCVSGRYNLCRNMRFLGSASVDPHIDGGMREYMVMPAGNCFRIPDTLDWGEATALEPLSIALHACARAGSPVGKHILITGGGTIGLLVLLSLRALGATDVTVSDPVAMRRELALKLGARAGMDPTADAGEQNSYEMIFDASGAPAAVESAVQLAVKGATIVYIGTITRTVDMPMNLIMVKELNVLGSFRTAHQFGIGFELMGDRRIDVRPLITGTYPIDSVNEAFAATRAPDAVKLQLELGS